MVSVTDYGYNVIHGRQNYYEWGRGSGVKMPLSVTDYGYNVIHRRQNDYEWCPLLTMVIMSYTGGRMIMSGVRY